jgi:type III restriction enzyme
VRACVKNRNLGLAAPYRHQAEMRKHRPDFIVTVQDRGNVQGDDDLPNLVVEIKGYRSEDAKEKKYTMDNYCVPGVNRLASHGRWAFAEFTDAHAMQHGFSETLKEAVDRLIDGASQRTTTRIS